MTTTECYETVNGILAMMGQPTIAPPPLATDAARLQHLFDAYTDALISVQPAYRKLPDRKLIPDALAQMLVRDIAKREKG